MKKSVMVVLGLVFVGLVAVNANATVTLISSYNTFLNYFSSPTVENFEDLVLAPGLSIVETGGAGSIHDGVYENIVDVDSDRYQIFTFSGPIYGFGAWLDLFNPGGAGTGLLVTIVDSGTVVGTVPNTQAGEFWGFMSDVAFTQVMFSDAQGSGIQETYFSIDLAYSQPVPVPAALWLLGSGLIGLAGLRRKFRS